MNKIISCISFLLLLSIVTTGSSIAFISEIEQYYDYGSRSSFGANQVISILIFIYIWLGAMFTTGYIANKKGYDGSSSH